jgi:hypothetical protein
MGWEAPPAFQFYGRDWFMSTRLMSVEARLVHIELLILSWDRDGIPANGTEFEKLPQALAMTPAKFKKAWAEIEGKWPLAEEGKRRNPRQEKQRQEIIELREKRAAAGKKSAAARGSK